MSSIIQATEPIDPSKTGSQSINVGTRKSKLALVQTDLVVEALSKAWPNYKFQVHARNTAAGDIDKVTPFKDMPVKNIWTHELEQLLVENELDILVHSLKDVPTQVPSSCIIGGVLARADPRDALVVKAGMKSCGLADLPAGAVLGTSSIRRTAQIALRYPHLKVQDVRGNVTTRLAKLDAEDGPFDALVLAAAGLIRLDLGHRITQYLDSKNGGMLYAVGQGTIGIEIRAADEQMLSLLSKIEDKSTALACLAERSLLRKLEGGCSAPLGVETEWIHDESGSKYMSIQAIVVSLDGKEHAETQMIRAVDTKEDAEQFGIAVAAELTSKGAGRIIQEIQAKKMTEVTEL